MSERSAWPTLICIALVACSAQDPQPAPQPTAEAASDPGAALRTALDEPDRFRRHAALAEQLGSMGAAGVPQAEAILTAGPVGPDAAEALLLVAYWAKFDPEPASRWALASAPQSYRAAAISETIEQWARADPETLVRELQITSGSANQPAVLAALMRGWNASEHPGLADYVRDLGPGFPQQRALAAWARARIAQNGSQETVAWAEAWLPELDEKTQLALVRQVGSELTIADPAAGVAWCEAHCAGPHGDAVRQLVATRWASRDVDAALDWLAASESADAKQRERAMRAAFRIGATRDRERALSWIEARDAAELAQPWLQPAVEMTVALKAADQPLDAMNWIERIVDPQQRERAQISVLRVWRDQNPNAADAWLESASVSAAVREGAQAPGGGSRR